MIQHNLDPNVAEVPDELIVYGGRGKAARNWQCFDQILSSLKDLENNQTLLIQSGKPVGVLNTHEDAPRVFLFYGKSWSGQNNRIKGIEPAVLGIGWNSEDWYIEEEE